MSYLHIIVYYAVFQHKHSKQNRIVFLARQYQYLYTKGGHAYI